MTTDLGIKARIENAARKMALNLPEDVFRDFLSTGLGFTSTDRHLMQRWDAAAALLVSSIRDAPDGTAMLVEGGPYDGCWLESTGTVSSEILTRFCPRSARSTFELYPKFQRDDGLLPYKILPGGPSYRQIQMVTPLARSVWNHYRLTGRSREFLRLMYPALVRFDSWLTANRDTRGTGGTEAFCAFDTGHDLSPRFWHVPDTTYGEDAARYDPDSPVLPYVAPDLTASVSCQRKYLAMIAQELGESEEAVREWRHRSALSLAALEEQCWNEDDEFYYDRNVRDEHVRVQSDVLLRVFACEAGGHERFCRSLERYLLNTRKFFSRYPFTSVALDDPRFDPHQGYNSWAGTTNFLTLLRAPHAFEHYGRFTELTWMIQPTLEALSRSIRFPQNINPWNGEEGFTESYSPSILCLLDFVERLSGILPRPEGTLWFTGLTPDRLEGRSREGASIGYRREIDGRTFDFHVPAAEKSATSPAEVRIDGTDSIRFPRGLRLVTDRSGHPRRLIGMVPRTVSGTFEWSGRSIAVELAGNQAAAFDDRAWTFVPEEPEGGCHGVIAPRFD